MKNKPKSISLNGLTEEQKADVQENAIELPKVSVSTQQARELDRLLNGDNKENQEDEATKIEQAFENTVTGESLLTGELKEPENLWGEILPKNKIGFLVGSSDTGKSMFLTNLAISVCTGRTFLGWDINPQYNRAIYVSSEDDRGSFEYRVKRMNRELNLNASELKGLRLITDWEDLYPKIETIVKTEPVDLIVLDAFGDVFDGKDMNANNQVRQFLQPYSMLAQRYGCIVLFMHHTGKRTEEQPPHKNNLIGSQAIEGKSRFIFELRNDKENPNKKHFCITKANGLPNTYKQQSFVLNFSDNFIFSNTGQRVPFDELAIKADRRGSKLTPLKASDIAHRQFLKESFLITNQIKGSALKTLICAKLGGSDKPNRELIKLWEVKGYIQNVGTERNVLWKLNPELDNIEPF